MITPSFNLTATERVLPKLALDFTTGLLDSRVTFTRTTGASNPATYVNNSGVLTAATNNQPRFDYDPVVLACKGLLIEESRQNLALYSSNFANAWWVKTRMTVATATVTAPDGSETVEKFEVTNESSSHSIQSTLVASSSGTVHSISVFVKAAEYDFAFIAITDGATGQAQRRLNLTTGVVDSVNIAGAGSWTNTSASAQQLKDGWWRFVLTSTQGAGTAVGVQITVGDSTGARLFTGTTGNGIYVWGAQREIGAFATSYIPTTSAALTRNADVATMTGTNFSDWFNQVQGTFVASCVQPSVNNTNKTLFQVAESAAQTERIEIRAVNAADNLIRAYVNVSGTTQCDFLLTPPSTGSVSTVALAYKTNSFAAGVNGGTVQTDSSGSRSSTNALMSIGSSAAGGNLLNGHVQKIDYYPQRLTNSEVQAFSKG